MRTKDDFFFLEPCPGDVCRHERYFSQASLSFAPAPSFSPSPAISFCDQSSCYAQLAFVPNDAPLPPVAMLPARPDSPYTNTSAFAHVSSMNEVMSVLAARKQWGKTVTEITAEGNVHFSLQIGI